jgi:spermidine synthase
MIVNGGIHSGIHLDDNDLVFNYARYNRFGGHFNPAAKKALQIGGGAYTYVNYFLTDTPLYDIEKVWELDGRRYYNNKTITLPVLFTNNLAKQENKRTLVYSSTSTPVGRQIEGTRNSIEVENQVPSTTVTVHKADIHDTGFPVAQGYVHIHETKHDGTVGRIISDDVPLTTLPQRPRTIIGKGSLISGANTDVKVNLDRPAKDGEVLYAMLHRDNGNGHFDDFLVDGYEQTESIDVVEIDPRTTNIAEEFFHMNRSDPRLRIFHEDGRTYINRSQDTYDIIYMDAFRSFFAVPWHLATVEALTKVHGMLNDNGVVVANIPASLTGEYSQFFTSALKTYQAVFPEVRVYAVLSPQETTLMQNLVFVAFKNKDTIREELSDDPEINKQLAHRWFGTIDPNTPILTDDFSPTDFYTDSFSDLHFF